MKKLALTLAIATAPFSAQVVQAADESIKVYGRANVSIDAIDNGAEYSETSLSSRASRLGFKAESKQDGYTAFAQIEQEISFAAGAAGEKQKDFASRNTFVGIKGDSWGSVQVGQFDTPFKLARSSANLFGDQVGDMRALTRVEKGRFDERPGNTVQYSTPVYSGLQANIAYVLHEGEKQETDKKQSGISVSATYKVGALDAAIAYEGWDSDAKNGERDAIRLAAAYKLTKELKLVTLYQNTTHKLDQASEADVYGIGGEYAIASKTALKAMYLIRTSKIDNADSDLLSLGVEHKLDSNTRIYANYAYLANDQATKYVPWDSARNSSIGEGVADKTASAFSLGLRFDF